MESVSREETRISRSPYRCYCPLPGIPRVSSQSHQSPGLSQWSVLDNTLGWCTSPSRCESLGCSLAQHPASSTSRLLGLPGLWPLGGFPVPFSTSQAFSCFSLLCVPGRVSHFTLLQCPPLGPHSAPPSILPLRGLPATLSHSLSWSSCTPALTCSLEFTLSSFLHVPHGVPYRYSPEQSHES